MVDLYIGDVQPAVLLPASPSGDGAHFINIAAPVIGAGGRGMGVIVGHMNWAWAEGVRQDVLHITTLRPLPELLVLGSDGGLLLGPAAQRGHRVPGRAFAQALSARWDGWLAEEAVVTGFASTRGTAQHPGLGWVVLARTKAEVVLTPLWGIGFKLAFAMLGFSALGGLLAGVATVRFGRVLRDIEGPSDGGPAENLEHIATTLRRLRDSTFRDPLTRLLNRAGFTAWRAVHPEIEPECTLLAIQLEDLQSIIDRQGKAAGDVLLAAIGRWLEGCLRQGDCAVRMGEDQFLICLRGPPQMAEIAAMEVATRFQQALKEGLPTSLGRLALDCDIGIGIIPRDARGIDAGLLHVSAVLERVKRQRRPEAVF